MHDQNSNEQVSRYSDIFDLRGRLYHQAMETWPDVREAEFLSVRDAADISCGMTVVDVPSGGAYLGKYLEQVDLISLESSHAFAALAGTRSSSVLTYAGAKFPLASGVADRVLSIAGLHHEENKEPLFSEMRRITRPQGKVVVADVGENSPVKRFLDEFVGRHCETGHSGWYFGDQTRGELANSGLKICSDRLLQYHWIASDPEQLAEFCRILFGMTLTDTATVLEGIEDYLGYERVNKGVGMKWELHCFICEHL